MKMDNALNVKRVCCCWYHTIYMWNWSWARASAREQSYLFSAFVTLTIWEKGECENRWGFASPKPFQWILFESCYRVLLLFSLLLSHFIFLWANNHKGEQNPIIKLIPLKKTIKNGIQVRTNSILVWQCVH